MNFNKKPTTVRGVPPSLNRQAGFKPVVAQLKTGLSAQGIKRPVAPPVYRPNTTTPNAAQPKMANATVNRKLPAAPPVYRPEAKKIVQPKIISQQVNIANSIRPITTKRIALPFSAVQLAKAAEKKTGAHECYARVVSNTGQQYPGEYNGIHAEINALESYLSSGGTLDNITRIELSSPPCKYCHIILSDLGVVGKVVCAKKGFGRCQGGSYGWWKPGGSVWAAIENKTGQTVPKDYAASVSKRKEALKAKK